MSAAPSELSSSQSPAQATVIDRVVSFAGGYGLAIALLALLIGWAGWWAFLANTRLLALFVEGGFVRFHDAQAGFVHGIPDPEHWVRATSEVHWVLAELASLLFIGVLLLRATQLHLIARSVGMSGTFTQHARTYLEGLGIARFLPFRGGHVRIASMFIAQGHAPADVERVLGTMRALSVFEIALFGTVGLLLVGWAMWVAQLFWPVIFMLIALWFTRPPSSSTWRALRDGIARGAAHLRSLADAPVVLGAVLLLSIACFVMMDIGAYWTAMAFTSESVILNVAPENILLGLVGANIARLITVTPGGVGQFEWGFATALVVGGLGLPECVAIACLVHLLMFEAGALVHLWVYILRVDYSFEVLKRVVERR